MSLFEFIWKSYELFLETYLNMSISVNRFLEKDVYNECLYY
jgi:hypothetical protein